tara:strand:+ start:989 stop:1204 length:216 start_codon:yes stop_codon:yes gene_type:complete
MKAINDNIKLYQRIFKSEDGEKLLEDLEKRCNVESTSFSKDPYETAFREGQRSVILYIKNILKQKPGGKHE